MVSLYQMRKVHDLVENHGYVSVENPEYQDLDPNDLPIGGPIIMKSPDGKLYQVFADASVVEFIWDGMKIKPVE